MRLVKIDFTKLKQYDRELCLRICGFLNLEESGVQDVDLSQLRSETRTRLLKFLQLKQEESEKFHIDTSEADHRTKLARTEADEAAGVARLQQYVNEQGLLPTSENAQVVKGWLDKNLGGYWSVAGVDAAIANLRSKLEWKPKTQAPVSAPISTVKSTEVLSDGSPRLPIDAVPSHKHTKAQLQDLDKQQRTARGHSRHRWIGAAF